MSTNIIIELLDFFFLGTNHLSVGQRVIIKNISSVFVILNSAIKFISSYITILDKSLKVWNISVEFDIIALELMDNIREGSNFIVFYLELVTIAIKIQFLSINPIYIAGDGGFMLFDTAKMCTYSIISLFNLSILYYDHCI